MEQTGSTPDPDKLKAFAEMNKLDAQTRADYMSVLQELSTISTALQNISDNPELYISSSGSISNTSFSVAGSSSNTQDLSFFALFNIKTIGQDTPIGRLVTSIIQELVIVNIIWLISVYIVFMFWIRSIFSPIEKIINNIKLIIDNSAYQPISYAKKDEFFPLISAINNLHKSLSIQENIRSNFLTDLSHEIRTPITAVKCYLEAIEDGYMEIDTKTLVLLQKELDRLTTTTEEIMHFERTTHPMEKNIRVKRFDLKKSIIPLVNEYGPQLHKTHQNILINIPDNSYIRMDESMLIQICHNIFSNFIKYAGKETTLICSYKKNAEHIIIGFQDNGQGVPEKDLPYIKEKFYRVDKVRSREGNKSMGIGLSIIEHIMRIHSGSFIIENSTPKGLNISLHFPK